MVLHCVMSPQVSGPDNLLKLTIWPTSQKSFWPLAHKMWYRKTNWPTRDITHKPSV